jgi:glycosyltransferase involved in cell wall biosynthesis
LVFAALGVDDRRFVVTTHYHGGSASSVRDQLLSMYRPFGRWAVRQADTVIAVSEWEHDQLAADFGVDAKVIPNGLDIERFTAADPEIRDQPYLLTVGRLEKYKGVQHAIQVMSEFPKYELLIAGSGPYQPELAQIAREVGVIDRVTFLGYVAAERLPKLYAGAEVYLTLSEFESYGMTVAEALATGTPCVVATSGALADWTAQRGCLGVDALDTAAISKAIRNAADLEGESTAVSSWETVVEQLLTEYDLLVD